MGTVDLSTLLDKETEIYLLLGGPHHGEQKEITKGQNDFTIMGFSPKDQTLQPVRYVRREIEGSTGKGTFKRVLYVESTMPVEQAAMALKTVLLQHFAEQLVIQFMEGGELIGSDHE